MGVDIRRVSDILISHGHFDHAAGCSHPDMDSIFKEILKFGNVCCMIIGLHGFDRFDMFSFLGIICLSNSTRHIDEIKGKYPEIFIQGGAGQVIHI